MNDISHALRPAVIRAAARLRHVPMLLRRMRLFAQPLRFAHHEISTLPLALPHRLRGSKLWVYLRHHSTDVGALNEVFLDELYRLPAPVSEVLNRLRRPPRFLDLGGHIGLFGVYAISRYPRAMIVSVEPDPLNLVMLRRCIRANGQLDSWRVIAAAASNHEGVASLRFGEGAASGLVRVLGSGEQGIRTVEVAVVDVVALLDGVDLVKMDIEGSEWEILADPRMHDVQVPAIVLEYHPAGCPEPDPRRCAERLLHDAGFQLEHIADQGPGMGMLWAWRVVA